jgi:hypothetical protein
MSDRAMSDEEKDKEYALVWKKEQEQLAEKRALDLDFIKQTMEMQKQERARLNRQTELHAEWSRLEMERQVTELQREVAAYEVQLPVVLQNKAILQSWNSNDPKVNFDRAMALMRIEEWLVINASNSKVNNARILELQKKLESL